jgi:Cu(I)/Ag(I) efflux system protein CusF
MPLNKPTATLTPLLPVTRRTASGKVTISHEAIKSLRWPAMTMGFALRDKALLGNPAVGRKIDFQLVRHRNEYVIVGVK